MLKKLALLFGAVFVLVGVLGFIPGITSNGLLLGLFRVDLIHNLVHLLSGLVALYAGFTSNSASKMWFQVFGVVYALVAILGFYYGDAKVLGFLVNNMADTYLHLVLAVAILAVGFGVKDDMPATA